MSSIQWLLLLHDTYAKDFSSTCKLSHFVVGPRGKPDLLALYLIANSLFSLFWPRERRLEEIHCHSLHLCVQFRGGRGTVHDDLAWTLSRIHRGIIILHRKISKKVFEAFWFK
jgi:hypothetical protein